MPHLESLGPLHFRNLPQLGLTLLTMHAANRTMSCGLESETQQSHISLALFRMLELLHCPE